MYLSAMGRNQFNEDSRVKVPVILQLVRLGYEFLPRAVWEKQREPQTNILRDEFARAFVRLNEKKTEEERIIATFEKREAVDSFAVVPSYDEMEEKGYSFSAGQYFDVKIEHIDITPEEFKQKMSAFMAEFNELSAQSAKLDEEIRKQMSFLEFS